MNFSDPCVGLIVAAEEAAYQLEVMAREFANHTDRHGDGPECAARAARLRTAIAKLARNLGPR